MTIKIRKEINLEIYFACLDSGEHYTILFKYTILISLFNKEFNMNF